MDDDIVVTVSVRRHKQTGKWAAFVDVDGKVKRTKPFDTEAEAEAAAYRAISAMRQLIHVQPNPVLFEGWVGGDETE